VLCSFARKGFGESDADLCSFARSAMTGKAKVRHGDGEGVGKAKAEQDDEAMDYLWKPSLPFVAGLTLGVAIAKATAVAKIRIKQFLAIRLAGKVVAGPCMVAMPRVFFIVALGHAHAWAGERQESPAGAIDTGMKTFHEWLAMREGLWLNDKNAVIGLSRLNPLPKNSAVKKSLAKGPKHAKAMLGVAPATPKPFKPTPPATF
jgi:hypothetical protein